PACDRDLRVPGCGEPSSDSRSPSWHGAVGCPAACCWERIHSKREESRWPSSRRSARTGRPLPLHAFSLSTAISSGTSRTMRGCSRTGPAVYEAWQQLKETIAGSMDARRYELVTLAAARELRSSYCALAHGKVLAERFLDPRTVR